MIGSGGGRASWAGLPDSVHDAIGDLLGAPVVDAVSQPGGFSPGSADRVRAANGRRAFVKTADVARAPGTVELHRREIAITARLPDTLPVPRLIGSVDADGWVAIVLTDVDGRPPRLPWEAAELTAVLAMLTRLAEETTPCPVPGLPTARETVGGLMTGAHRLAADGLGPDDLDLPELVDVALPALDGCSRSHREASGASRRSAEKKSL